MGQGRVWVVLMVWFALKWDALDDAVGREAKEIRQTSRREVLELGRGARDRALPVARSTPAVQVVALLHASRLGPPLVGGGCAEREAWRMPLALSMRSRVSSMDGDSAS